MTAGTKLCGAFKPLRRAQAQVARNVNKREAKNLKRQSENLVFQVGGDLHDDEDPAVVGAAPLPRILALPAAAVLIVVRGTRPLHCEAAPIEKGKEFADITT